LANAFNTPLRYPGGKGRLSQYVAELIKLNGLNDGCYAEPFCGGAGIALSVLYGEKVRRIHLNDLDRSVFAFWSMAVLETEELCRRISSIPVDMDTWHAQRSVQKEKANADLLDLAVSTFYLNRTNRSGILTAGVIGGLKQAGTWKLDARFNKKDLLSRIEKIGVYASRIQVTQLDVVDFINQAPALLPANSLIYFDPPYFNKADQLYQNHFKADDHRDLAEKIQSEVKFPWLVSYDNVDQISELYAERDQEVFSLHYSANDHYEGTELMVFSDGLKSPEKVYASRGVVA